MPQSPDTADPIDDEQPRIPWVRRSAAALGWAIGFAVAIGLVVAAVLIPVAFTVNTAMADDDGGGSDEAAAMTEETDLPEESMQHVTLEATSSNGGTAQWEIDGTVESEDFSDSWSKDLEIPSGSWPRLVVTGDDGGELSLECKIKLDDEVVFEHSGTESTKSASCSVFV